MPANKSRPIVWWWAGILCFVPIALPGAENLLRNGGFEDGWAGWRHDNDPGMGALTREAAHAGETGLRIADASDGKGSEIFSEPFDVRAGGRYTLQFWGRCKGGGAGVFLRFFDQGGKELRTSKDLVAVEGAALRPHRGSFTAPEGAVRGDLYLRSFLKSTCVADLDDFEVTEGDMPNEKETKAPADAAAGAPSGVPPEPALLPENPAWAAQHPRLLVRRGDIPALIARTRQAGEPQAAWNELLARCERLLASPDPHFTNAYARMRAIDPKAPGAKGAYEGYYASTQEAVELLAFAYLLTGDKRWAECAREIVMVVAERGPVLEWPGFFYTRSFYLRSVALVYDWCYDALSRETRALFRKTIAIWARIFYERKPREAWETWAENTLNQVWNWNAGISGALGLACLAILDETDEPVRPWLFQAARQVENFWRFAIDKNGGAIEGPGYIGYGAAPTPYFIESLREITGEDLYENTHYRHLAGFFPHEILPGGGRNLNLSDSSYVMEHWQVMLYAQFRAADRRLPLWCYRALARPVGAQLACNLVPLILWWKDAEMPPAFQPGQILPPWAWSPWRGVMISRTGWGPDDVLFTMHAQEYTLIRHDQVDKGQVNLFAYGQDFLIDSGYGNDGGMTMSQGAGAHNLVTIDGSGPLGSGGHACTSGAVRDHLHSEAADFARADLRDAWEYTVKEGYNRARVRAMKKAQRHALFARGPLPYLVVFEDLALDENPHRYGVQWHTGPRNAFSAHGSGALIRASVSADRYPDLFVQPFKTKGDGGVLAPGTPVGDAGEARARITLAKSGRWKIWALTTATGADAQKSDSIFFSVDGGKAGFSQGADAAWFAWKTATDGFQWAALVDNNGALSVPPLPLAAGSHELCFKVREEGAGVLAVLLVPEGEKRPLDELVSGGGEHVFVPAERFELLGPLKRQASGLPKAKAEAWLHLASPAAPSFRTELFQTTRDGSHSRLTAEVEAAEPDLLWALVPYRVDSPWKAANSVRNAAVRRGKGILVDLPEGLRDLSVRWDGKGIDAEGFESDARFLWLRRDAAGALKAWALSQGRGLKGPGGKLFSADGEDVSAVCDGSVLDVSARELRAVESAASIRTLRVNGLALREGAGAPLSWKADGEASRRIRQAWNQDLY